MLVNLTGTVSWTFFLIEQPRIFSEWLQRQS